MRRVIFCFFVVFVGCASGPNSRSQVTIQGGYTKQGNVQNINSQNDAIVTSGSVIINNNYVGLSNDQNEQAATLQATSGSVFFKIKGQKKEKLDDGKYKVTLDLIPIGKNVIPRFTIDVITTSDATIESLQVTGESFDKGLIIEKSKQNNERTHFHKEFQMVNPNDTRIIITTSNYPRLLSVNIVPFQK